MAIGMVKLSVCLAVTLCLVVKRYILHYNKMSEQVTQFYKFHPPPLIPTLHA